MNTKYVLILGSLFLTGCYDMGFQPAYIISQTPPEEEVVEDQPCSLESAQDRF